MDTLAKRITLFASLFFLLIATFFSVEWFFANSIASQAGIKEVAQMTTEMAPNDPQTHYSLAVTSEKTFIPQDFDLAIEEYEKAASLAPNNYLYWLALGNAHGRKGDSDAAEKAFRKAFELAPNYSQINWALGNLLVRKGLTDEGYVRIRLAIETNPTFAPFAVDSAWELYDGDVTAISQKLGPSSAVRASLASTLAKNKRLDESAAFWTSIPENERQSNFKQNGTEISNALFAEKKFRSAMQIQSSLSAENYNFTPEKFTNGSFEDEIKMSGASMFEWQIADGLQPQVALDGTNATDGKRSLVLAFASSDGKDFRQISQSIIVESGTKYHFETFALAKLRAQGTLKWEVADTASGKILGSTEPIPANTTSWQKLTADFTVPAQTEAVTIRLSRVACANAFCSIDGKVWFDNFSLAK